MACCKQSRGEKQRSWKIHPVISLKILFHEDNNFSKDGSSGTERGSDPTALMALIGNMDKCCFYESALQMLVLL